MAASPTHPPFTVSVLDVSDEDRRIATMSADLGALAADAGLVPALASVIRSVELPAHANGRRVGRELAQAEMRKALGIA